MRKELRHMLAFDSLCCSFAGVYIFLSMMHLLLLSGCLAFPDLLQPRVEILKAALKTDGSITEVEGFN